MSNETQLLTFSRMDAFKVCRKKHQFAYELAIRREVDAKALRMGSAYHAALECLANREPLEAAAETIRRHYANAPPTMEEYEWAIECETVIRLACGYQWRWQDSGIEFIAAEMAFELPLVNPETGKPTPIWKLAGKIDGIVRLLDGRLAVLETKLMGDDISQDASLWRRLRIDHQISLYVIAARRLGYDVDTVLYNCARKPAIKPVEVPILDEQKQKIVLDERRERVYNKNGSPKQTGSTAEGWFVQSRAMTPDEWGEKLNDDIAARPEFYFQRIEVPRIDSDLAAFEIELWEIQQTIRDAQNKDRWYRTVNRHTCDFCSVFDLCSNQGFDLSGPLPEGFVRVTDIHPELERDNANRNSAPAAEEIAAPATCKGYASF